MKTVAGEELTEKEAELINKLRDLANDWAVHGQRLYLFATPKDVHVMLDAEKEQTFDKFGCLNVKNQVTRVRGICHTTGTWAKQNRHERDK